MSWLHNHIQNFVVPGIKAIIEAKPEIKEDPDWLYSFEKSTGGAKSEDVSRYGPYNLRPARACQHPEAGIVYTALRSFNARQKMGDEKYEAALRMLTKCDPEHFITKSLRYSFPAAGDVPPHDVIHNVVKNSWRALRRVCTMSGPRTLILPGRDVWLWEVMCRKRNMPSVYDPRVSRLLTHNVDALRQVINSWGVNITPETVVFDTGFAGSIYRAICGATDVKMTNLMLSTHISITSKAGKDISCQIFPNHANARAKALAIEYLPKYWKTGTVRDGQPVQYLADLDEFVKCAALTIWFWHHRSPRWIKQVGKGEGRRRKFGLFAF